MMQNSVELTEQEFCTKHKLSLLNLHEQNVFQIVMILIPIYTHESGRIQYPNFF